MARNLPPGDVIRGSYFRSRSATTYWTSIAMLGHTISLLVKTTSRRCCGSSLQPLIRLTSSTLSRSFYASSSVMSSPYSLPAKPEWSTPKKEGDSVPSVTFKTRVRIESNDENPFEWKDLPSDEIFKGKRVVLFALPGAFTPTCSSTHLPGYEKAYDEMKSLGVDEVYCLSVNDAFVMRQWGLKQGYVQSCDYSRLTTFCSRRSLTFFDCRSFFRLEEDKTIGSHGFKKVKLIPDGTAHFTRGMGFSCVWEQHRGFGERSWRYSAVINDGKIEKLFIEGGGITQDSGPDPFEVTDADTMLNYLKSK